MKAPAENPRVRIAWERAGVGRRTHWRAAARLGLQAIITQRNRDAFRAPDSDQYASPHARTLEAMRTRERFSSFQGAATGMNALREKPDFMGDPPL